MNIEKTFAFLITDYHMNYAYQKFPHCPFGNWIIGTHSYYNDSGCFTIHILYQRNEIDFYYAKAYSTIREKLCESLIDEQEAYPEIWWKAKQKFMFSYRPQLYLNTLAEVIKKQIEETGSFFGVNVC